VTKAHCALNLPPHARSYAENANEVAHEEGTVESMPKTEGETQENQPPIATNRVITENGIVSASEYIVPS